MSHPYHRKEIGNLQGTTVRISENPDKRLYDTKRGGPGWDHDMVPWKGQTGYANNVVVRHINGHGFHFFIKVRLSPMAPRHLTETYWFCGKDIELIDHVFVDGTTRAEEMKTTRRKADEFATSILDCYHNLHDRIRDRLHSLITSRMRYRTRE